MKLWAILLLAAGAFAQDPQDPVFGTTVYASTGFEGLVHKLKPDTRWLPDFRKMTPIGKLYTDAINIPARRPSTGFPAFLRNLKYLRLSTVRISI
jgi:hypothetical protein